MCVCVCVCQRKTKDRADGMREKSAHCPRRDSNLYLWDTRPQCFRLHHDGRHASRQSNETLQTLTRHVCVLWPWLGCRIPFQQQWKSLQFPLHVSQYVLWPRSQVCWWCRPQCIVSFSSCHCSDCVRRSHCFFWAYRQLCQDQSDGLRHWFIFERPFSALCLGKSIEYIESFVYLGSLLSPDARSSAKVERCLACASWTFRTVQCVFQNKDLSVHTERLVYLACVLSTLLWCIMKYVPWQWSHSVSQSVSRRFFIIIIFLNIFTCFLANSFCLSCFCFSHFRSFTKSVEKYRTS